MQWRAEVVHDLFHAHDAQLILNIRLPSSLSEDFSAWFYEKSGVFTVRSAYRLACRLHEEENGGRPSSSGDQDHRPIWKSYWNLPIPHKILVFGWKVMHNGLATQENKRKRRIIKDDRCEICGKESESGEHALFRCGHTGDLREAMRQYWSLPVRNSSSRLLLKICSLSSTVWGWMEERGC